MKLGRYGENDRRLGRYIVYGKQGGWRPIRLVWHSGNGESKDCPNYIVAYAFGWYVRIVTPWLRLKNHVNRVPAKYWDAETIAHMGRDWYEEIFPVEYGFSYDKGFLQLFFGPQTHDSVTTKDWCKNMGWAGHRQIRHMLYDTEGRPFWKQTYEDQKGFERLETAQKTVPKKRFELRDYDGTTIVATTYIEEREFAKGEGWFKWLRYLTKNKVYRSLCIEFSAEVGPQKGSWKGGIIGCSENMDMVETHEMAMRRFCSRNHNAKNHQYQMQFIGTYGLHEAG